MESAFQLYVNNKSIERLRSLKEIQVARWSRESRPQVSFRTVTSHLD